MSHAAGSPGRGGSELDKGQGVGCGSGTRKESVCGDDIRKRDAAEMIEGAGARQPIEGEKSRKGRRAAGRVEKCDAVGNMILYKGVNKYIEKKGK